MSDQGNRNKIFTGSDPLPTSEKIFIAQAQLKKFGNGKNPPTTEVKIKLKRKLTEREIIMCRLVFKDSIDYSKVWVIRGGIIQSWTGNAMTPLGNIILPRDDYDTYNDFSNAPANVKHWFIHEVTHVWQYQLGLKNLQLGKNQLYIGGYTHKVLSPDSYNGEDFQVYVTDIQGRDLYKEFNEFNFEQQGRIIELYYDAEFLKFNRPQRSHHQISIKLLPHVMRILRDFLINPKDKSLLPSR